ncbi:MAG TPA: hypothetical protein DCX07_04595 [Phycisphaerales bacterium]|nr:hypothetical protein [Phycisphaerales bacterium]
MARVYVMKTGQTTWEQQGRVESAAGAPLTDAGEDHAAQAAGGLAAHPIAAVYASRGQAERQTAEIVARQLGVKVRIAPNLREIDYGLWQGLTKDEIQRRNPRVFRHWEEDPSAVRPPDGETLQEAQERIRLAVLAVLKRHKAQAEVLLVLRPVVLGLLRCLIESTDVNSFWKHLDGEFTWTCYELSAATLNRSRHG